MEEHSSGHAVHARKRGIGAFVSLVLAACLIGGGRLAAEESAEQTQTVAALLAILAAVEIYKEKFGEYPCPAKEGVKLTIDGKEFDVSGSLMLYQTITADGDDKIKTELKAPAASDGKIDERELENTVIARGAVPDGLVLKTPVGYLLLDGYGHPFQYSMGGEQGVNPNFDLWSFGVDKNTPRTDKASKEDAALTAK